MGLLRRFELPVKAALVALYLLVVWVAIARWI